LLFNFLLIEIGFDEGFQRERFAEIRTLSYSHLFAFFGFKKKKWVYLRNSIKLLWQEMRMEDPVKAY